jgi:hypothetical protein
VAIFFRRILTPMIAAACSWACGGDVGRTNANAAAGGVAASSGGAATNGGAGTALTLPFDPTAGCRDLSITGCPRCCTSSVDQNGVEQCNLDEASQNSITYSSVAGPCSSDCPVCAQCSVQSQQALTNATNNPRPECDCLTLDTGIDPCFGPSGCECFCSTLMGALISCPQSGQAACNNGNHCRPFIVASPGLYAPGSQLEVMWLNFGTQPVYLGNCGNLAIERNNVGSMTTLMQASPCSAGATGLLAANGGSLPWKIVIPSNIGAGQLWLHGTFYTGCTGGITDASHCAAGPFDTYDIIDVKAQ